MVAVAHLFVYQDEEGQRRATTVGNNVAPKTALILDGQPVITVTGSGDYAGNAITMTANGTTYTLAGGRGGVGLEDDQATVTPNGTAIFDVAGASAATAPNTPVYMDSSGDLTLTAGGNTRFGAVDFFSGEFSVTATAVKIGVNLG